ncbi:MAG: hypothetical protein M1546_24385 [Chloroflexi bacterium]|nr:hypothetical protein [Chloroflexota bacterium]
MDTPYVQDSQALTGYSVRYQRLPAFDLIGFTKIVESGGELYREVRSDGRWAVLRDMGGDDKTIYGVASLDKECPKGRYRYTLAVKASAAPFAEGSFADARHGNLFSIHIRESEWLVFELEHFGAQYGGFWQADPYALIQKLGWIFNARVGLHIDAYALSYASDDDGMTFMMPVRRRA